MKYEKVTNEARKQAGIREKYAIEHAERIEKKTIAGGARDIIPKKKPPEKSKKL